MPAQSSALANSGLDDADIGVTPIAGIKGGQSTFIGGDDIGISRDSKKADAAWNFIAWCQSDEAQIEVVAKNGNVLTRTDLANNKYITRSARRAVQHDRRQGTDAARQELRRDLQRSAGSVGRAMQDVVFGDGKQARRRQRRR